MEPSETPSYNPLVPNKPINAPIIVPSNNPSNTPNNDIYNPTRTHIVYLQATDFAGKVYTDQTGRFPVTSNRGYKYIRVAYDYDSNTIYAEPMKIAVAKNY